MWVMFHWFFMRLHERHGLPTAARTSKSRNFPIRLAIITAVIAGFWLGFLLPARSAQPVPIGQQVLKGHVPAVTRHLTSARRLESNARLDLAIGLPLRNREQLTNLLQEISRPSSPNFRHYLTPDQFTASFGPSQADYQAVSDFAKSHGLAVQGTHPTRTTPHADVQSSSR